METEIEGKKKVKNHYYLIIGIIIWLILIIITDFFKIFYQWNAESYGICMSISTLIGIMTIMLGIMIIQNKEKLTGYSIFKYLRADGIGATIIMLGITLILASFLYTVTIHA